VTGVSGNNIVGFYEDATGEHGFVYNGSSYTILDAPSAAFTEIWGISGNNMAIRASTGSFLYDGTTYTPISNPQATGVTVIRGVSGNNALGTYQDNTGNHGFLYDGSSYTAIDVPSAITTTPYAMSGNIIVGSYMKGDGSTHGFFYNGSSYTTIDPSVAGGSFLVGITGIQDNLLVGIYSTADETAHGFLYDGNTFTTIDHPLAGTGVVISGNAQIETGTGILGIDGNTLVGSFVGSDGISHGFVTVLPEPSPATLLGLGILLLALAIRLPKMRKCS